MSIIKTENLCKSFGSVEVLKNVSLTVDPGEVVVIIGPSGAGKSTYLRSLNRLEKSTSGKIWIDDQLIEDRVNGHNQVKMAHKDRAAILLEMGMVFQRFNLFPHKTALQNVMLAPMTVKGVPEKAARDKAFKLLNQVIRCGQERGELRDDMTVNEIVKAYAMFERALMYDWCLSGGEYALSKYADQMIPIFLAGFKK